MSALIDQVQLDPLQKNFMKHRWLDQVLWMEAKAAESRNRYYALRMVTIIGGVMVPALVSFSEPKFQKFFQWTAFGLSQAVAISAAVEELFQYGERYRHYRVAAEELKMQGWRFLQLSGPYEEESHQVGDTPHTISYPIFAERVEEIIKGDLTRFVGRVGDKQNQQRRQPSEGQSKEGVVTQEFPSDDLDPGELTHESAVMSKEMKTKE